MLSCAPPANMPPTQHAPLWDSILQNPVKEEPTENNESNNTFGNTRDQTSGFYSEGFHSTSPSGSSKDSNGQSPQSVGSNGEPSPTLFDNLAFHAKMNLGLHLDSYRNGKHYPILTPPGFDNARPIDVRNSPTNYNNSYSPHRLIRPNLESTPRPDLTSTPPKSPEIKSTDGNRYDRYHDSGFQNTHQLSMKAEHSSEADPDNSCHEDTEFDDEPGLRVPAVNSHGKVKTFKCKQCEFVAVTKLSFWEHSKEHIKPEKMLTCPKCPFVTEYKHHLEYHMRNHFGSKPFQCNQCSYSCVNKSMLNSHLKSHSNIYQYRCADCNYATKYCHSLKLHLRKYQHSPAMVLNHDGTPNPLPIIDVYGTRRGPKQKPLLKVLEETKTVPPQPPTHPLFSNPFPVNFPYGPLLSHPFLFPPNNNYNEKMPSLADHHKEIRNTQSSPNPILHQRLTQEVNAATSSPSHSPRRSISPLSPSVSVPQHLLTPPTVQNQSVDDALDLTNSKQNTPRTPTPEQFPERQESVTPSIKNRRKGRAFKLQPAALRMQHGERVETDECSGSESDSSAIETPTEKRGDAYRCQYCDISFGDLTMHTIHMGYHGYNDPFMCNKCGERSSDRVSFFIHLGRAQHA